jgi:catechol 2,3-dioxygenase-like lactoylglutathione lyase family enzyme
MKYAFHHVALTVRFLESSVAYYCNTFGFEVLQTHAVDGHPVIAHLKQPDGSFVLELIQGAAIMPHQCPSVHLGFACQDVSCLESELAEGKHDFSPTRMKVGTENIVFVTDDDGYLIEVNDGLA